MPHPNLSINDPIDADYLSHSQAAEAYVSALAIDILRRLELWSLPFRDGDAVEIAEALNLSHVRVYALDWLLFNATASEYLTGLEKAGRHRYQLGSPPSTDLLIQAREALEPFAAGVGSTIEMVEYAAERYPEFLRGERSGAAILFKGQGLERWERYFSEANPLYQVHNQLAAEAMIEALKTFDRPARILELGAGTGGGSATLISALQEHEVADVEELILSDIAPSFLVRVLQRLKPPASLPIRRHRLNFDRPFVDQGIEPGSIDVMVEVNALHNCQDLEATLGWIRESLSPEGCLVISESLCQSYRIVHQDLIFNLLPPTELALSFAAERGGFISRFFNFAHWQSRLDDGGFQVLGRPNAQGPELAWIGVARPALVTA